MGSSLRVAGLVAGLGLLVVLSGCPGIGGGGGGAAQQTPPGVLPPPGLESGGVRTLVGATITPPTNAVLLVSYTTAAGGAPPAGAAPEWQSVRRVSITENTILVEGLNYNGRMENEPKDVNRMFTLSQVTSFAWRYEGTPAPPGGTPSGAKPGAPPSRRGR